MTNTLSARHAALQVLHKVFTKEAYANLTLNEVLQKNIISPQDRHLATELVYGSIKNKLLIEYWLKKFVPKYQDLPSWIALNLVLAVYQLQFLQRVPHTAAVDEAVKLAKRYGHKGTVALTNGVLRNMLRTADAFSLPSSKNVKQYLSIKYSHPEWLVERWLKEFGEGETEELLMADNLTPPLVIRINTLKITREDLMSRLMLDGASCCEGRISPFAIEVHGIPALHTYPLFLEGFFQVQDESSMLASIILDPKPDEIIIDVCAGPGGKTTQIAEQMQDKGKVLAFDIYDHKVKLIEDSAKRLGLNSIKAARFDARALGQKYPGYADRVLLDVPCSGLGVLRRRPDARWRKEISDIKVLSELQKEILNSAAETVKAGGVLVYSTCTITHEENMDTVERFLQQHPDFVTEDITPYLPVMPEGCSETALKGFLTLYPHKQKTDGFFICRMRRRK